MHGFTYQFKNFVTCPNLKNKSFWFPIGEFTTNAGLLLLWVSLMLHEDAQAGLNTRMRVYIS
jgi:hypothetical protein